VTSAGGNILSCGIMPTPAVALLTRQLGASGGIVVSASHNPFEYNGIKFFDAQGFKLKSTVEDAFEQRLQDLAASGGTLAFKNSQPVCTGVDVGLVKPIPDAAERYIENAIAILRRQDINLRDMRIAVDCGHGAAWHTTPRALRQLRAKVTAINTNYDGDNINVSCGSTNLDPIKALVKRTCADVGFAHDGDADRVIAIDSQGNEVDGDIIEAICAIDFKRRGMLTNNAVVSTVMANLGFFEAMRKHEIDVVTTQVGDANVLAAMRAGGYILGGEQSGHMIFLEENSTGDGLVTALQLLAVMRRTGQPLVELAREVHKYPQVMINVQVADKSKLANSDAVTQATDAAAKRLNDAAGGGRVLVRPSGTEPLVRVMVEASSEQTARQEAEALAVLISSELA
jgi:phosphoglucosamine mutase